MEKSEPNPESAVSHGNETSHERSGRLGLEHLSRGELIFARVRLGFVQWDCSYSTPFVMASMYCEPDVRYFIGTSLHSLVEYNDYWARRNLECLLAWYWGAERPRPVEDPWGDLPIWPNWEPLPRKYYDLYHASTHPGELSELERASLHAFRELCRGSESPAASELARLEHAMVHTVFQTNPEEDPGDLL